MERISHFRILELLGRGGMGVVYKALDERLERVVALKVLPESGPGQEERRQRFMREARSAARVTHPAIVGIYEVGAADGRMFIAMELVVGESLRERLAHGPLSTADATRIALDVASALAKAHSSGIIHRDLKPDNVMLTPEGQAKVLDFGIAKLAETRPEQDDATLPGAPLTRDGQLVGTPGYMSPEQARSVNVDVRSDVFSFGVLLYEMLGGRLPWAGKTPMDLVLACVRDDPAPLAELARVPPDLLELVNRCLERDPDKRLASADELVRWLGRSKELLEHGEAATDLALASAPLPAAAKPAPRSGLRRTAAIVLSVSALAAVALGLSRRGGDGAPASSAPSAVAPANVVTLATLPVEGCNPQASALMRSGLSAIRDATWHKAGKLFEKATIADPDCGAAFLRLAIIDNGAPRATVRARFQRAAELREKLATRDASLLDVNEPTLARDPPVPSERKARMLKLLDSNMNDAEFLASAAWFLSDEDPERAERLIDRALALDPGYADAWQSLAVVRGLRGNTAGARQALDRCVKESASTTDCVYEQIRLGRASQAPCSELEANARILVARESPSPNGHYYLALALAGQGERDAAFKALSPRWNSLPADRRGAIQTREAAQLALHFADFAAARKLVGDLARRATEQTDLAFRAHHTLLAVDLALETGRKAEARAAVESAARELPAWSRPIDEHVPKVGFWFEPWLLGKRIELGTLAKPSGRELDRWSALDDIRRRPALERWALGQALPAVTSERAKSAVSAMPAGARPATSYHSFIVNHAAGKALFLADRARDAEPFLRAAASNCDGFELPLIHAQNQYLLARSREAIDDRPGACAAYRALLDRWGGEKPLPATASTARTRSTALGCEG